MRILQVGYAQDRRFGNIHVSNEHKLWNGLIRNNYNVLHYSDRDMAAFLAPFGLRDLGKNKSNRKLIETAQNFRPDMILLGHCDIIRNETLERIREILPNLKIAYRNVDPLFIERNVEAIKRRVNIVDTIFITTAGPGLDAFRGNRATIHFMPNSYDPAVETGNNSQTKELPVDLFFCGNSSEQTDRRQTIEYLKEHFTDKEIQFKTPGYFDQPNVWGVEYEELLASSKMGLNLNRQEGHFLYSSDRLAQLMATGVLTFIHRSGGFQKLLGENNAVFYETKEELIEKIRFYKQNDTERQEVASSGRTFYREHFSCSKVAKYIVERTFGETEADQYIWSKY